MLGLLGLRLSLFPPDGLDSKGSLPGFWFIRVFQCVSQLQRLQR